MIYIILRLYYEYSVLRDYTYLTIYFFVCGISNMKKSLKNNTVVLPCRPEMPNPINGRVLGTSNSGEERLMITPRITRNIF